MAFTLPPLPYDYSALDPHIDEQTMRIHHDKHHAACVNNLNAALEGESALQGVDRATPRQSCQRAGRQADRGSQQRRRTLQHTLFWELMTPGGCDGTQRRPCSIPIDKAFGSFDGFKELFALHVAGRFGGGWGWLVRGSNGRA